MFKKKLNFFSPSQQDMKNLLANNLCGLCNNTFSSTVSDLSTHYAWDHYVKYDVPSVCPEALDQHLYCTNNQLVMRLLLWKGHTRSREDDPFMHVLEVADLVDALSFAMFARTDAWVLFISKYQRELFNSNVEVPYVPVRVQDLDPKAYMALSICNYTTQHMLQKKQQKHLETCSALKNYYYGCISYLGDNEHNETFVADVLENVQITNANHRDDNLPGGEVEKKIFEVKNKDVTYEDMAKFSKISRSVTVLESLDRSLHFCKNSNTRPTTFVIDNRDNLRENFNVLRNKFSVALGRGNMVSAKTYLRRMKNIQKVVEEEGETVKTMYQQFKDEVKKMTEGVESKQLEFQNVADKCKRNLFERKMSVMDIVARNKGNL